MLFQDRTEAGQKLAQKLKAYANRQDVLVLGLPRGGVPVAFEVAMILNAPLDVFLVRKLGVPGQEEFAMGAIALGVCILNREVVESRRISQEAIARAAAQEQRELERREYAYRGNRPFLDLNGLTIILVDDGMATGATMQAAVVAVEQQNPQQIIVAVPVAAPQIYHKFRVKVDEIICVEIPRTFNSVGYWYENFDQTTDTEVQNLLQLAVKRTITS